MKLLCPRKMKIGSIVFCPVCSSVFFYTTNNRFYNKCCIARTRFIRGNTENKDLHNLSSVYNQVYLRVRKVFRYIEK